MNITEHNDTVVLVMTKADYQTVKNAVLRSGNRLMRDVLLEQERWGKDSVTAANIWMHWRNAEGLAMEMAKADV